LLPIYYKKIVDPYMWTYQVAAYTGMAAFTMSFVVSCYMDGWRAHVYLTADATA